MKYAHQGQEPVDFSAPDSIIYRNIDPRTGLLSTEQCRSSLREAFLPGTEPRKYCEEQGTLDEEPSIQDEAPE
jgi:membrane carboxypeptidase/penicillin-binding protein